MLRRHFITGEDKPDIIITYHSSKHIPFFGGKETKNLLMHGDYDIEGTDEFDSPISIDIVLDTWNDGVGQWGIKFNDPVQFSFYNYISNADRTKIGTCEGYIDLDTNDLIMNDGYIKSIIYDEKIVHINGDIIANEDTSILEEVALPNSLKYLTGNTFIGQKKLKSLIVPENVIRINVLIYVYKIDSSDYNDLEELTLLPFNPPSSTSDAPLGTYGLGELINPNFKIRVYADCIDKYKNDTIWGQYSELYDSINNAIIYKTIDNKVLSLNNSKILSNAEIGEPNRFIVTFKEDIVELDSRCFEYEKTLEEIILPSSITKINSYAFYACENLKKINIPDSVQTIGDFAFSNCIFAKNNIIGDYNKILQSNYSYVKVYDFETEDGYILSKHSEGDILEQIRPFIKNVIISDDIKYIGYNNSRTFSGNKTIESIYVGKNVKGNRIIYETNIVDNKLDLSLGYSDNIKSLKVDPLNPYYDSRNDCNAIIETATNTLLVGCPTTTIPNTVEIIEYNGAFDRINIKTLNIPLSVKKITNMYRPDTINYTKINTIIYEGTIEQWNAIEKIADVYEKAAITIKCSDGEIKYFTRTDT